eukprot:TRINITY_DN889_c0_g1_i1.p1 TRINITY_DN889_c0_g1~~TRINITY_DN889_c0_g1_i1.p1  ORF type:complete len:441 (-),score=146.32 TRINITY_DN889_c0_g1_i1:266-1492(-)
MTVRKCFTVIALCAVAVFGVTVRSESTVLIVDKYVDDQKTSISELSIADYVSFALGGPVVNRAAPRDALPARDVFDRARANLFVLVDGVGADQIAAPAAERLLGIAGARFLSIAEQEHGQHTVGSLVSGGTANSFADVVSQTFAGQALTLAASGDHELASLLAARRAGARKSNDLGYFWNGQRLAFETVYEAGAGAPAIGNSLLLDGKQAADMLRAASFQGVTLAADRGGIKATLSSGAEAHFSFSDQRDVRLMAELAFLCQLSVALSSAPQLNALVTDQIPDSYAFGVSSLKRLSHDEAKFAVAQGVVSACIAELVGRLSSLYDGRLTAEVVFIAAPPVAHVAARSAPAYNSSDVSDPDMVNFQILLWTNIALVFVAATVIYVMISLGSSSSESDSMLYRTPKSHAS